MSHDIAIRNNQPAGQNPVREEPAPGSLHQRIYGAYARVIQGFIHSLFAHGWHFTAGALGSLLLEPFSTLRAGSEMIYYLFKRNYDFSGVNPQELDDDELGQHPILCLHGDYHSPTAFTAIASAIEFVSPRPIFTVSLQNGDVSEEDMRIINAKIEEIKALYRAGGVENISIDLIGHSRGGYIARRFAEREEIRRIAILGDIGLDHAKICEINGRLDSLLFPSAEAVEQAVRRAAANPHSLHMLNSEGHLGLLYSPEVHELINGWLHGGDAPNSVPADEPAPEGEPENPFLPPSN